IQELFVNDDEEVFKIQLPSKEESRRFFEDLVVNQAAKPPAPKTNAAHRTLEVLPVALPPKPQQLTEEERRQLEEQEEDTLRELRLFLRDVTQRLAVDRRFRAFTKPVDPEEDLMGWQKILSSDCKISDRLIRHRACTLKDTAYAIVREEMNEDFEHRCKEIKESRQKRGMCCSSSKYAPSYYHVMPKQNCVPDCKETDPKGHEKMKISAAPVDSSTPRSNGKFHFILSFLEIVQESLIH
ncbi:ATAD2 protein, partial [Ardeotis kori]|nr:ATAD2 protein [Ardeotis kori]